jgi:hypothetical protein
VTGIAGQVRRAGVVGQLERKICTMVRGPDMTGEVIWSRPWASGIDLFVRFVSGCAPRVSVSYNHDAAGIWHGGPMASELRQISERVDCRAVAAPAAARSWRTRPGLMLGERASGT